MNIWHEILESRIDYSVSFNETFARKLAGHHTQLEACPTPEVEQAFGSAHAWQGNNMIIYSAAKHSMVPISLFSWLFYPLDMSSTCTWEPGRWALMAASTSALLGIFSRMQCSTQTTGNMQFIQLLPCRRTPVFCAMMMGDPEAGVRSTLSCILVLIHRRARVFSIGFVL